METIRILLQNHELKPSRGKMWCIAELNEEYIIGVQHHRLLIHADHRLPFRWRLFV